MYPWPVFPFVRRVAYADSRECSLSPKSNSVASGIEKLRASLSAVSSVMLKTPFSIFEMLRVEIPLRADKSSWVQLLS